MSSTPIATCTLITKNYFFYVEFLKMFCSWLKLLIDRSPGLHTDSDQHVGDTPVYHCWVLTNNTTLNLKINSISSMKWQLQAQKICWILNIYYYIECTFFKVGKAKIKSWNDIYSFYTCVYAMTKYPSCLYEFWWMVVSVINYRDTHLPRLDNQLWPILILTLRIPRDHNQL